MCGGGRKPALFLVRHGRRRFAVKDVAGLRGPRRLLWRFLLWREARAYEALAGIPGIARSYGLMDPDALLLEFLDGEVVRRESMPLQRADFFERLDEIVRAMHERGWVHLDLGHRRNVLVLGDGTPAVVDLANALGWAKLPLLGRFGRWIDRSAIRRLEDRYRRRAFASPEASP